MIQLIWKHQILRTLFLLIQYYNLKPCCRIKTPNNKHLRTLLMIWIVISKLRHSMHQQDRLIILGEISKLGFLVMRIKVIISRTLRIQRNFFQISMRIWKFSREPTTLLTIIIILTNNKLKLLRMILISMDQVFFEMPGR